MDALVLTLCTVGAIVLMAIAVIIRGWVLSILWGWFAVPILGAPQIDIPQAIGIALVVGTLTHQYVPSKEGDIWPPLAAIAIGPLVALLIGWIVKGFM